MATIFEFKSSPSNWRYTLRSHCLLSSLTVFSETHSFTFLGDTSLEMNLLPNSARYSDLTTEKKDLALLKSAPVQLLARTPS